MNDSPAPLLTSKRLAIIAAVALLAVAGIFFFIRRRAGGGDTEFITAKVERGAIRKVVNATGTVQALLTVQVGSQVTGQVQALYADYNSVVREGQMLAKIDPRRYQADVSGAEANLLAAQARVKSIEAELNSQIANQASAAANVESARVARDNAATQFVRAEELRRQGISSQNEYDNAKANRDSTEARHTQARAQAEQVVAQIAAGRAQIEQARAQVAQAQAALNQSQVNLEYTDIRSPVDGVVISRNVDVGQTVAASLQAPTLFLIAGDLTKMQLQASVDEADIGLISISGPLSGSLSGGGAEQVRFTVDAFPNRNFQGRISEIRLEPLAVQNVVTYSVIVNVDNARLELKPGMTANLTFTIAEKTSALRLPNAALRYTPPGQLPDQLPGQLLDEMPRDEQLTVAAPAERHETAPTRSAKPAPRTGPSSALAPGQLWKPGEKIQFPAPEAGGTRSAVIWILNAQKQPEQRKVELGIADGSATEVASGKLAEGDAVIIGDSTQAAESRGGIFGGGGPPR